MKYVTVNVTGTWSTELEVPDNFDANAENLLQLVLKNAGDFDFQDGGTSWQVTSLEFEGEEIEQEIYL